MPLCVRDSFCYLYANDSLLGMDVTECECGALQENIIALCDWPIQRGKTVPPFTLFSRIWQFLKLIVRSTWLFLFKVTLCSIVICLALFVRPISTGYH